MRLAVGMDHDVLVAVALAQKYHLLEAAVALSVPEIRLLVPAAARGAGELTVTRRGGELLRLGLCFGLLVLICIWAEVLFDISIFIVYFIYSLFMSV